MQQVWGVSSAKEKSMNKVNVKNKYVLRRSTPSRVECRQCKAMYNWTVGIQCQDAGCCSSSCYVLLGGALTARRPQPAITDHVSADTWLKFKTSNLTSRRKKNKGRFKQLNYPGYKTPEWHALRLDVVSTWGTTCMACNSSGAIRVEHIIPPTKDPEIFLDFMNVQVLCLKCAKGLPRGRRLDYRPKDKIEEAFEKYVYFKELRDKDND